MVLRIGPLIVSNELLNTITCYYSTLRITVSRNKASQDGRHCSLLYFKYWKMFPMHAGVTICPPSCYQWSVYLRKLPLRTLLNVFPDASRNIQEDCELSFWCLDYLMSLHFISYFYAHLIWIWKVFASTI